ncbi:MAG: hypothetical protein ABJI69_09220 [Balneola sp.]
MKIFENIGNPGKREQDSSLKTRVLQAFREENPSFEYLEFYSIVGRSEKPEKSSTATGGKNRAINSAYADNEQDTEYGDVNLKIYGDDVRTDKAWNRSAEGAAPVKHIQNVVKFSHSLARHILDHFINGDTGTSALQFDGLKAQTPAGNTQTLKAANDTDGLELLAGNSDAAVKSAMKVYEAMDKAIKLSRANVGQMNGSVIARLKSMKPGAWTQREVNGHLIDFFNNVPIIDAGYNKDESAEILPFGETVGATDDCSSAYFFRTGERMHASIATNIGLDVDKTYLDGNFIVNQIEGEFDIALLSSKCVERIAGLRLG